MNYKTNLRVTINVEKTPYSLLIAYNSIYDWLYSIIIIIAILNFYVTCIPVGHTESV